MLDAVLAKAPSPIVITVSGNSNVPFVSINNKFPFDDINSPSSLISYGLTLIPKLLAISISVTSFVSNIAFPFFSLFPKSYL